MSIIDDAKEVAALVKKVGDIELYQKIVSLQGEVVELSSKNLELERKNAELEKQKDLSESMCFQSPFYYRKSPAETSGIPYCPRCWEKDKQAVHLVRGFHADRQEYWKCPSCRCRFDRSSDGFSVVLPP
jgi:hypothetical protein